MLSIVIMLGLKFEKSEMALWVAKDCTENYGTAVNATTPWKNSNLQVKLFSQMGQKIP